MGHCHCIRGESPREEPQIPLIATSNHSAELYKKILILGNKSCGKSTIFKQINCIHGWGFNEQDRTASIQYIRQNIVSSILLLLSKSQQLYQESYLKYSQCFLDLNNENIADSINIIMKYRTDSFSTLSPRDIDVDNDDHTKLIDSSYNKLSIAIENIWSLSGIKQTFYYRHLYPFDDNIDHFLDKTISIFSENYIPNNEDMLKHRSR